jgi:hypothetical protein
VEEAHTLSCALSDTERMVEGIRAYAKQRGLQVYDDSCAELQPKYEACKSSVANMVIYFIDIGVLDKKKHQG